jgi:hypothetical protein
MNFYSYAHRDKAVDATLPMLDPRNSPQLLQRVACGKCGCLCAAGQNKGGAILIALASGWSIVPTLGCVISSPFALGDFELTDAVCPRCRFEHYVEPEP